MSDTKHYVQVFNPSVKDGVIQPAFFTLWTAGSRDKAVTNAKKRSAENPGFVFRAVTAYKPGDKIFPMPYSVSLRSRFSHEATYFVAGIEHPFNPVSAYLDGAPSDDRGYNPKWGDYMKDVFFPSLTEMAGQEILNIQREKWYDPRSYYPKHPGWNDMSPVHYASNKLVAHTMFKSSRGPHSELASGLIRVTYTHPDGSVEVEYWQSHELITEEDANVYINSVMEHAERLSQRILKSSWVGSHRLSDVIANGVDEVGLRGMRKAFQKLCSDLVVVSENGQLTDEQRERINASAELMAQAVELMNED